MSDNNDNKDTNHYQDETETSNTLNKAASSEDIDELTMAFQKQTNVKEIEVAISEDDHKEKESKQQTSIPATPASIRSLLWDDPTVPGSLKIVANWMMEDAMRRILIVCGAGISVNAGIPDFRTPGTGLYDNLAKYQLPYPEAIFDVQYYQHHPMPFIQLAKHIWPGRDAKTSPVPTLTHIFFYLLQKHSKLLRIYTQNIDGLEYLSNVDESYIVECHGHFRSASCITCHKPATDMKLIQKTVCDDEQVPICQYCSSNPKKKGKPGYIKPDIVFFGEGLPSRFHNYLRNDIKETDCCFVLGTSLQVAPVSHIPDMVSSSTKRILFNKEHVGNISNFKSGNKKTPRDDVFHPGDCDQSILLLCDLLGWKDELLYEHEHITKMLRQKEKE